MQQIQQMKPFCDTFINSNLMTKQLHSSDWGSFNLILKIMKDNKKHNNIHSQTADIFVWEKWVWCSSMANQWLYLFN